ncbi:MAG TPA: rhomboid family intramembrane serine protease [Geobacteraceae bacterium]|nr:rhomboid family intramembrane serine protease [Geobacteraceae bacterium]
MESGDEKSAAYEGEWLAVPSTIEDGEGVALLSRQRAHLWALVLEARFIPCRIEAYGMGQCLLVPAQYHAQALRELSLFEEENRGWPPEPPPVAVPKENVFTTVMVLALLIAFHQITLQDIPLFGLGPFDWTALGSADAGKIASGQLWRAITALTLHADWLHLFGNLALGGVFIVSLCRELGSGLGWSLILASGTLGNLANACLHDPDHRSVGASTALFGAVGILAALNHARHRGQLTSRRVLPAAAALALLCLLGTEGNHTDLGAHLFGFLAGIALGLIAAYPVERHGRPGLFVNALLALFSAAVVAASWWAALSFDR